MRLSRQHLLLGLLIGVGALTAGDWVLSSLIQQPLEQRRARGRQLQEEIEEHEKTLADGRRAGKMIEQWRDRSLPADIELARSLYRSWLLERIEAAKLQAATVDSGSASSRGGLYRSLPFTVRVQGTLDQLTELLFEFSQAAHLHRIQSLDLNPVSNGGLFDLSLGIDALIVPGAERKQLNPETTTVHLASAELEDYRLISRRNIFGIGSAHLDPRRQTYVTAITRSNGEPRVWFTLRVEDKVLKLRPGDVISVEGFHGTIAEVWEQDVVIDAAAERWLLTVGENLAEALPVPPER
jgi:hypothetical protein